MRLEQSRQQPIVRHPNAAVPVRITRAAGELNERLLRECIERFAPAIILNGEQAELPEVQSADLLRAGAAPRGSKGIDPISLGALAVSILPTAVPKLVEVLGGWLMRGENRKIKIKTQMGDRSVELEYSPSAMSHADLKQLVEALTSALQAKQA